MKLKKPQYLLISIALVFLCYFPASSKTFDSSRTNAPTLTIPTEGNSWVIGDAFASRRVITKGGITNWNNPKHRIRTYFYVNSPGLVDIWFRGKVTSGSSKIKITFGKQSLEPTLTNTSYKDISLGTVRIKKKGYHFLEFEGLTKTGNNFAEIASVLLGNAAANSNNIKFIKDNFYFSRRGPSVHLWFNRLPTKNDIKWFYNEITVPKGQDVVGSYYMATGFSGGYFGIQVNSPTERKILFSVWSPYKTDNPNSIPAEFRINLLKKGNGVNAQKFGNEGSGGQSFRRYNWNAGTRYRFLLKGEPARNNSTDYTAYFFAPEIGKWELIASFRRPKTSTYLKGLYSFLENFKPDGGVLDRKVLFANQWVADARGNWHEVTEAKFTGDSAARKGVRFDFTGGVEEGNFYLKNCGFFNGNTNLDIYFKRKALGNRPQINLNALP